ncbi:hypothetical protein GW17_00060415 [Ensete ventricosum]|nr:hypothetical protein GW17_00060415 [Ensete ventricosum]
MKRGRWSEYTEAWPAPISSRSELSVNLGLGPSVKSLASGDHTRCVTSPGWVSVYKATPVGVDHSSASRVTTDPSRLNPHPTVSSPRPPPTPHAAVLRTTRTVTDRWRPLVA